MQPNKRDIDTRTLLKRYANLFSVFVFLQRIFPLFTHKYEMLWAFTEGTSAQKKSIEPQKGYHPGI